MYLQILKSGICLLLLVEEGSFYENLIWQIQ